jgi:F-box protein 9
MKEQSRPVPSTSETEVSRGHPPSTEEDDEERELGNPSALWNQDGWTLTWPIWHLLPLQERKQLAHDHGYKTIGEFEEYMSLHRAMDDSETVASRPYPNHLSYPTTINENQVTEEEAPNAIEDDEDSDCDDSLTKENQMSTAADLPYEELIKVGGRILMLHDEILHQIFAWLPVDTYATLARVSPHWKHLTRTEAVYRRLCERLYLNQSKRRQLHVSRFGGSYRTMLEQRPRVRAAGGVYVLKYSQIKHIQRDMWTEVSSLLRVAIVRKTKVALTHGCRHRSPSEPYWKVSTIDTSTFKRMAECCMP